MEACGLWPQPTSGFQELSDHGQASCCPSQTSWGLCGGASHMRSGGRAPSLLVALGLLCLVPLEFKLLEGGGSSCQLCPVLYLHGVMPDTEQTIHRYCLNK